MFVRATSALAQGGIHWHAPITIIQAWNDMILMCVPMLMMAEGIRGGLLAMNQGIWNYSDLELLLVWLCEEKMCHLRHKTSPSKHIVRSFGRRLISPCF